MDSKAPPSEPAAVHRIVLTGGPCGGKTTVQVLLSDVFQNMGYRVYRVSETATILLNGGVVFANLTPVQSFQFQLNLLKVMMSLEQTYFDLAAEDGKNGHKAVVICDRGTMDPSAYMPRVDWLRMLKEAGIEEGSLRDSRYDCVFHLVTAAKGAEAFFSSDNNAVRSEGIELARTLDGLIAEAWLGHPNLDIIDNTTGFEEKQNRLITAVLKRLGLNENQVTKDARKRKFLLKGFQFVAFSQEHPIADPTFPVAFKDFIVTHDYLLPSPDQVANQTRLRKRESDGHYLFSVTHRKPIVNEQVVELRRSITGQAYDIFLAQRDPAHASIIKKRRSFVYKNQTYQLDYFISPPALEGLVFLEAYLPPSSSPPDFLNVEKEITGDSSYSMFNLSKINQSS